MSNTEEIERLRRLKKRAMSRRRHREIARGTYVTPFVDPGDARAHIAHLETYGLSRAAIGQLAGVHGATIEQIVMPGHYQYRKFITREMEEKILSARFDLDRLPDKSHVDSSGTQRRIRALARLGWALGDLAPLLGVSVSQVGLYSSSPGGFIFAGNARRVRDLYAQLSMTLGPTERAAKTAAGKAWAPPWAWDDDTMDHPDTKPNLHGLRRATASGKTVRRSEETLEDLQWVLEHEDDTATPEHVAARLGVSKDGIYRALSRVCEQRAQAFRSALLGEDVQGPLDLDDFEDLQDVLREPRDVRNRLYANAEAAGHNITARVAS